MSIAPSGGQMDTIIPFKTHSAVMMATLYNNKNGKAIWEKTEAEEKETGRKEMYKSGIVQKNNICQTLSFRCYYCVLNRYTS